MQVFNATDKVFKPNSTGIDHILTNSFLNSDCFT